MLSNAPIDVKLAGEGGDAGYRVGIWRYLKVCRQISCPRANYFNQMHKNVPTLLHIVAFDLSYFLVSFLKKQKLTTFIDNFNAKAVSKHFNDL